jgi:Ca2+-transporting ATPase
MNKFQGLSQEEAHKKLQELGRNELRETEKKSVLSILSRQVKKNFIIYLLAISAFAAFLLQEHVTTFVIFAVITLVILTGFIQEYKAEKAISELKKMIMSTSRVVRNGQEQEVPSEEIVPGDIVVLRIGERVPADCIVLDESNLKTNESLLTGESTDIQKIAVDNKESPKENSYIYMGSYVVNGRCIAQVIHTGMNTKFGNIAGMISTAEKKLPLQDKVNAVSKYMVFIGLGAALITGVVLFIRADVITFEIMTSILIVIIALSVSAFPEGFPVVLTTTLAYGMKRMAKQNAIVNRMSIIETLGETSVICSDKTGTITKGEMTVKKLYTNGQLYDVSGIGYETEGAISKKDTDIDPQKETEVRKLIECAVICNDSTIERTGNERIYHVIGSSTEGALLILGAKVGVFKEAFPDVRIEEMPFDSKRKMMSVLYKHGQEKVVYAKGALEVILKNSVSVQTSKGVEKLTEEKRKEILESNKGLTSQAFRTLGFAYKVIAKDTYSEDMFIFVGLCGMEDPPREEVIDALKQCAQSGIKVKMITGDNKETAQAIAKQVGIIGDLLTGQEMDQLTDDELTKVVLTTAIFARVKPEDKLRIVKALKANDEIVTMTGDGVNDAPALKEAHIGVAMGINGTDVSRSVADITLKDDNFATIVVAIREGRTIFNNIRKFVTYELSCNLADIYILFVGMILAPYLGWYTPIITALQILFMNLITDDLPAITLGFNSSSKDIMNEPPRKNEPILTNEFLQLVIVNGVSMGMITFAVSYISFNLLHLPAETARTTLLVSTILVQIANAYNYRSFRYLVLNRGIFANKYLVIASLTSISILLLIVYTPLRGVFETTTLGKESWIIAICAAFTIVVIFDLMKLINNKTHLFLRQVH